MKALMIMLFAVALVACSDGGSSSGGGTTVTTLTDGDGDKITVVESRKDKE